MARFRRINHAIAALLVLGSSQAALAQNIDFATAYETSVSVDLDISDLARDVTYIAVTCTFFSALKGDPGRSANAVGWGDAVLFDTSAQGINELYDRAENDQTLQAISFHPIEGFDAAGVHEQVKINIYAEDRFDEWGSMRCMLTIMTSDLGQLSLTDMRASWRHAPVFCTPQTPVDSVARCAAPGTEIWRSEFGMMRVFDTEQAAPLAAGSATGAVGD